jgi:ABC-type antimicrobial peptide transport system permease subunit
LIIRTGVLLIGGGLLIGVAGAFAATRVIQSFLYGITPTDPLTFAAGTIVLGGVAFLACYVPARRASRIDPMLALRHE